MTNLLFERYLTTCRMFITDSVQLLKSSDCNSELKINAVIYQCLSNYFWKLEGSFCNDLLTQPLDKIVSLSEDWFNPRFLPCLPELVSFNFISVVSFRTVAWRLPSLCYWLAGVTKTLVITFWLAKVCIEFDVASGPRLKSDSSDAIYNFRSKAT